MKVLALSCLFSNTRWLFETLKYEKDRDEETIMKLTCEELERQGFEQTEPIFNRDGWYYDSASKFCWHEYQGTAWIADAGSFLYEFQQLDTKRLSEAEILAIKTLMIYGTCPQELRDLLYKDNMNTMVRNTYRSSAITRKRITGS